MPTPAKLVIGTVQFGMSYGVANQNGQVTLQEAAAILSQARRSGLTTLDTAIVYGESEKVLGAVGVQDWQVISKLPPLPDSETDVDRWVQQSIDQSLAKLRIPKLHGLLLHRPDDLNGIRGDSLFAALEAAKKRNKVDKIGISIYSPDELSVLSERFRFDIVQAPYNVLDRRIVESGWAKKLKSFGTEVHVRSAFLQGLLLMNQRPAAFDQWNHLWNRWESWLEENAVTALKASLNFVLSEPSVDRVIVGVDSKKQWAEIFSNVDANTPRPPDDLASQDLDLITPSRWSKK